MPNVLENIDLKKWDAEVTHDIQNQAITALENGKILFLPQLDFFMSAEEKKFLSPDYVDSKVKNISFDIRTQQLKGARANENEVALLRSLLERFAKQSKMLISTLFPHYKPALEMARTSFRPAEIFGRPASYRKDDTRLHVDAFPSNPNQGNRILRVFTNVNPENKPRLWRAGEPFAEVAAKFYPKLPAASPLAAHLLKLLGITRSYRTAYDHYMLHLHNQMKADLDYQINANQAEIKFPPFSTWIVYTDCVSHAAMSGQHLFEQTFHLPVSAMLYPELAPLRILEKLCNKPLT